MAKWLSVHLRTKWLWVRVQLQSLRHMLSLEFAENVTFHKIVLHDKIISTVKFIAHINIKLYKSALEEMFVQLTSEDAETKHHHICFLERPGYKL